MTRAETTQPDALVVETVERLLAAECTHDELERSEASGWSAPTWNALAAAGFPWVGIPEAAGGSGGTLYDLGALIEAVGRFAAPVPLAETALLGGWCLSSAGLVLPEGPVTIIDTPQTLADGQLHLDGIAAWGRHADRILAVTSGPEPLLCVLRPEQVSVRTGANMAGEARDRVSADLALTAVEHVPFRPGFAAVQARGTVARALAAAGALEAITQITVEYTNDRRQFGKPVATFQAVQLHLVTVAECAVRARMAAHLALTAIERGTVGIEVAAARVIVDDAITHATRAAHQAHGAMGVTREYPLHQFSRRLWSWRHEWGTTREWRRDLGRQVVAAGADDLFDLITGTEAHR